MIMDISGLSTRNLFFQRVLWWSCHCWHAVTIFYNTFLNSPTLLRLLPVSFKLATRTQTLKWLILERAGSYSNTSKRCNLCLAEVFHSLFADKHPSLNKKDWGGANMPPPAEVFSSLNCYLESTPLFLCSGLLHLFLQDFALLYTFLCPGLRTSEALYRLVA